MKVVRVMTAGYFDPLHIGHIRHIQAAKELGTYLTVVVSRDDQCIRKKGYCFMSCAERMEIIRAISGVNSVVPSIDNDNTCAESLRFVQPDIFAKGGDRMPDNMPDAEIQICEHYNIKIEYGVGGDKIQASSELVRNANNSLSNIKRS